MSARKLLSIQIDYMHEEKKTLKQLTSKKKKLQHLVVAYKNQVSNRLKVLHSRET